MLTPISNRMEDSTGKHNLQYWESLQVDRPLAPLAPLSLAPLVRILADRDVHSRGVESRCRGVELPRFVGDLTQIRDRVCELSCRSKESSILVQTGLKTATQQQVLQGGPEVRIGACAQGCSSSKGRNH